MSSEKEFMELALEEAKVAYSQGNLPVGAVLVIKGKLVGKEHNSTTTDKNYCSHAESKLISQFSKEIKELRGLDVRLYTTLEPCLMCASIAGLNRIKEIIYACPDNFGGSKNIEINNLPEWYHTHWPKMRQGPFEQESYSLLISYLKENKKDWEKFLERFERKQ